MKSVTTAIHPLLMFSLCGASAAVLLYIWYRTKDDSDRDDIDSVTPVKSHKKSSTKVECVIPNAIIPLVHGRAGANVKDIESKTATKIRFREHDEHSKICEITGAAADVKRAAALINQEASPAPIITQIVVVPQTACGKIIGRCGEALQEICRKSLAKVYVEAGVGGAAAATRVIKITGTQAQVQNARALIDAKVQQDEEMRRGVDETESKREPRGARAAAATLSAASSMNSLTGEAAAVGKSVRVPNSADGQLDVYVSAIASPARFWLQLVGPQTKKLDALVESMSEYYDVATNRAGHQIADPYLGQIVAAVFKYDGKWYRAEIVGILPNEFNPRNVVLDLYFVDFGDSEYVAPHEVFELRTDFLTLRFQAIECFLANVKPAEKNANIDEWKSEAISRFEELTHVAKWQKMQARIVATKERKYAAPIRREGSPVPGVELYDSLNGKEISVAAELIRDGYAVEHVSAAADDSSAGPDAAAATLSLSPTDDKILRLDGGDADAAPKTPPIGNAAQLQDIINGGGGNAINGDGLSSPPQPPQRKKAVNNGGGGLSNDVQYNERDKFTAICENTTNENYENIKIDTRRSAAAAAAAASTFINSERQQNGLNANDTTATNTTTVDGNLNDVIRKAAT